MDGSISVLLFSLFLIFLVFFFSIPFIYTKIIKRNTFKVNILLFTISIIILYIFVVYLFPICNYASNMAVLNFNVGGFIKFKWEITTYFLSFLLGFSPLFSFFISKKIISKCLKKLHKPQN